MSELSDAWQDVVSQVEGLGAKLKAHLDREGDAADTEAKPGETESAVQDLGDRIESAFDGFGNAVKDSEVHQDMLELGRRIRTAMSSTWDAAGAKISEASKSASQAASSAENKIESELNRGDGS